MRQFFNVFKFELSQKLKQKTFIISTVIMALVVFGITFIPRFSNSGSDLEDNKPSTSQSEKNEKEKTEKKDLLLMYDGEVSESTKKAINEHFKVIEVKSEEEIKQKINNKEAKLGAVIHGDLKAKAYSSATGLSQVERNELKHVLEHNYKYNIALKEAGISVETFDSIVNTMADIETVPLGKNQIAGFVLSYAAMLILYFTILMNGQIIAMDVAKEKSSRAMEILITNVKAKYLIIGKVISGLVTTLINFFVIGLSGYIGYLINIKGSPVVTQVKDIISKNLSAIDAIVLLSFIIVGVIMYYFIYAALSSMVEKVEDLNQALTPITIIIIAAFMAPMVSLGVPEGSVMKIASYVPFSSPLAIFPRYLMTNMKMTEVLLCFSILLVATIIAVLISIKMYRKGTLNYGNKFNLFKIFKRK